MRGPGAAPRLFISQTSRVSAETSERQAMITAGNPRKEGDAAANGSCSIQMESKDRDVSKQQQQENEERQQVQIVRKSSVIRFQLKEKQDSTDEGHTKKKCCRFGPLFWCKKYFWEGQQGNKATISDVELSLLSWREAFLIKYRRVIGFLIPAILFHFFWWALAIRNSYWHLYPEKYPMVITMIFGSVFAGMTSQGGGVIAFPVMTLALKIPASVARDFVLMIQSCGMIAATFTIIFMRVALERYALITCTVGGVFGIILGLELLDPILTPAMKKLGFVSIWFAFAVVLVVLNRIHKRQTFDRIQDWNWWKMVVLLAFGIMGGLFTSLVGTGMDICSFMVLTLLFRITEKVSIPTSVILMALNSVVGFYWQDVMKNGLDPEAWEYLAVCTPIVVLGAPIGSVIGSQFHRLILSILIVIINMISLISGYVIVRPLTPPLIGGCLGIMAACFIFFFALMFAGQKLLEKSNVWNLPEVSRRETAESDVTGQADKTKSDVMDTEITSEIKF